LRARILFSRALCRLHSHRLHWLCELCLGLAILRLFIGMAGGTFVMCSTGPAAYSGRRWNCQRPSLEDGNGGGVTQLVMGSLLFPLLDLLMATLRGLAYGFCRPAVRVCLVLPFTTSVMTLRGNYSDLKKHGAMPESLLPLRSVPVPLTLTGHLSSVRLLL
jgi:hypothetical protein